MLESEAALEAAAAPAPEVVQPAASAPDPTATLIAQLAAADRARVAATKLAEQHEKDLKAAQRALAERDEQDMSELEKAQKERDRYKAEAAQVKADYERISLAARFPLAAAKYGDEPLPSEAVLESIQAALAVPAAAVVPVTPEPIIDKNRARPTTTPVVPRTSKELFDEIVERTPTEMPKWVNPWDDQG